MDVNEFRRAGHEAIEQVAAYYEKLQQGTQGFQVAPSIKPGDIYRKIPDAPPEKGEDFAEIQKDFENLVLPGTCHWQHPSFFAYFPANSTFESIIADIYATATSTPGFNHSCNPASTEIEQAMTNCVGQLLGLDDSFAKNGVIQGSASESALVAAIAARERCIRLLLEDKDNKATREEITSRLVIYGSTQTHSLGAKAGLLLGLPFRALETTAEENWALTGETVGKAIEQDKAKGLIPFMIGAWLLVDNASLFYSPDSASLQLPLLALQAAELSTGSPRSVLLVGAVSSARLLGREGLIRVRFEPAESHPEIFIHVDAAWAGVYLALPEQRAALQLDAINARGTGSGDQTFGEVHSFCTNLHKSGLVAFDCSQFFVRDSRLLTEVLDVTPPFLRNHSHQGQVVDYRNWGISLGRRFRSLKVLFVLKSYGITGFQNHLRRSIALTRILEDTIKGDSNFELVTPRSLALLVFRLSPPSLRQDEPKLDKLNRRFYANLHRRTSIQLTSTIIGGIFCIRFAVGSVSTRDEHIHQAWSIIQEAAEEEL